MINREKRLFMTIGLPRSGKTTLRNEAMNINHGIVLISCDQLRLQIYGQKFYLKGEDFIWAIRKHMLEILMQNKNYIFIDETNTTVKRRKDILKLAKEYKYKAYGIIIDTPKEICIKRAKAENDKEIIPIIERMSLQMEFPIMEEGFYKLDAIINNDYASFKDWDCFKFPFPSCYFKI